MTESSMSFRASVSRCAARSPAVPSPAAARHLLPLLFEQLLRRLFEELRRGPLLHVEIVFDVAVAQHEVLADLDRRQVLW
jgi:hypothetical protein